MLLYDLTSTYFEIDAGELPEGDKRRHGYSRDHRPDCPQVVIALVVTPEGLPLAYKILPGNTKDSQTLRQFLAKIETQYGKARRVWVMDRGIPTEAVLAVMRNSDPPVLWSAPQKACRPRILLVSRARVRLKEFKHEASLFLSPARARHPYRGRAAAFACHHC